MKIERIDDNTIKCFISIDEMQEYDVAYTDFISRTEKAQELMHRIIDQAHEEVGYQPPKFAFEMQIMMIPDQGMVLTFSEKEPIDLKDNDKVDAFLDNLKNLMGKLTDQKNKNVGTTSAGNVEGGAGSLQDMFGAATALGNEEATKKDSRKNETTIKPVYEAVFVFAAIAQVMDFATSLPSNIRVTSALYKMDGDYFVHITKGGASYDRYSRVCIQALEFGELYRADVGCDEMLKEHGECLIPEKALKLLRGK